MMKDLIQYMNAISSRLIIPLIIIALAICTSCSPSDAEPELSPVEATTAVMEQQLSATLQESGKPEKETGNKYSSPLEGSKPGESSGAIQADETSETPLAIEPAVSPQPSEPAASRQSNEPAATPQPGEPSEASQPGEASQPPQTAEPSSIPQADGPSGQGDQIPVTPQASDEPVASQNNPPPTGNNDVVTTPPDDGPAVLTIGGNAVNAETAWSLNRLQALQEGYREITYSTTNNWPNFSAMTAKGVSLTYLLRQAGIKSNAASIKFVSTDGYNMTLAYSQVFGTLYSYANHSASGSSGASKVDPVIAWAWGDVGKVRPENLRPFFGQSGPWEVNTSAFVKDLFKIEVSTASAGTWAVPGSSIADGSAVPAGAELELSHGSMDNVRIYYTLDGSEPDYNSPVYNQSTSYFQPQLIKPLILTESVTIKAFAAGLGKGKSATATFVITVR